VDTAAVRPFIDRGYTLLAVGMDTLFLGQSAQRVLAGIKEL